MTRRVWRKLRMHGPSRLDDRSWGKDGDHDEVGPDRASVSAPEAAEGQGRTSHQHALRVPRAGAATGRAHRDPRVRKLRDPAVQVLPGAQSQDRLAGLRAGEAAAFL